MLRPRFNGKRLHVIGTLVCQPDGNACDLLLAVQEKPVQEEAIVAHLEALKHHRGGPIVLLREGLPSQRSAKVAQYRGDNGDRLWVEPLPAYAPALHPVEYVWSPMKGQDPANFCPDTIGQLRAQVDKAHQRLRQEPTELYDFLAASGLFPSRHERSSG